jgi:hypothetical protein
MHMIYKQKLKNMHAFKKLVKICKYIYIQTETTKRLFNDSYRYLKLHIIEVSEKNMLFSYFAQPND